MQRRCFACDKILGSKAIWVDTHDAQIVEVGTECAAKIRAAGPEGYQPPKGGPRLWMPHPGNPA